MINQTENKEDTKTGFLKVKDFFLTQEEFHLEKNEEFGYYETKPVPENLDTYYESEQYISHTDSQKKGWEKVYQFIKNYNIRYKISLLENLKKEQKILDYGCGAGDFLLHAKNKNFQVFGMEPNPIARKIAKKKIGKETLFSTSIESINEQFDFITLWHVLEHIPNLHLFIPELKNHLKDDGKLYIAVPNFESFDAKFYKEYWAAYDVPRHLWHFSPQSLESLFNSFGMKIEKTHPLWFDSFYVSMLSEKYKKTTLGILRAITIGTVSNLVGLFNGNYSSVIYQISKKTK